MIDQPKTLHIEVTEDNIKSGFRFAPCECPIAIATARRTGKGASVSSQECRVGTARYALPAEAQVFVDAFDLGKPVKPFAFTMECIEEVSA